MIANGCPASLKSYSSGTPFAKDKSMSTVVNCC